MLARSANLAGHDAGVLYVVSGKVIEGQTFKDLRLVQVFFLVPQIFNELAGGSPHEQWAGFTESYIRQLFVDAGGELC